MSALNFSKSPSPRPHALNAPSWCLAIGGLDTCINKQSTGALDDAQCHILHVAQPVRGKKLKKNPRIYWTTLTFCVYVSQIKSWNKRELASDGSLVKSDHLDDWWQTVLWPAAVEELPSGLFRHPVTVHSLLSACRWSKLLVQSREGPIGHPQGGRRSSFNRRSALNCSSRAYDWSALQCHATVSESTSLARASNEDGATCHVT